MAKDVIKEGGIWVISEPVFSKKFDIAYELNNIGKHLCNMSDTELTLVIVGNELEKRIDELRNLPYDFILCAENSKLENVDIEQYGNVIVDMINEYKPNVVLFGSTIYGRTLAPWVAAKLQTGLTADCIHLEMEKDLLIQVRPAYGDNIVAKIVCANNKPQMATVRSNIFQPSKFRTDGEKSKVIKYNVKHIESNSLKIIERIVDLNQNSLLEKARIVFGIGRGIKSPKNIDMVFELAQIFNAQVGATRMLVDMGMIEKKYQIGQTGVVVRPDLYVAFGISGYIQHMSGVLCNEIWAVNIDETAPIFQIASLKCVADLNIFMPMLLEQFKK